MYNSARTAGTARGLRVNIGWSVISNFAYAAGQAMMLLILARTCAPEQVGLLGLAVAVCTPLVMLSNLQLRSLQVTDQEGEFLFEEYLTVRLVASAVSAFGIVVVCLFAGYSAQAIRVIACVGFVKLLESIIELFHGSFQRSERMDIVGRSLLIRATISLAAYTALLLAFHDVFPAVCGLAGSTALVLLFIDARQWRNQTGTSLMTLVERCRIVARRDLNTLNSQALKGSRLVRLAWQGAPLGLVQVLAALATMIPRYAVERICGPAELGIFAALAYFIVVGQVVVTAVGQAAMPRLVRTFAEGDLRQFTRLLLTMAAVGCLLSMIGIAVSVLAGPELLGLLFRREYSLHSALLTRLMFASGLYWVAWFLGFGMTAARHFSQQVPLYVCSVLVTLATALSLVPSAGSLGAADAMSAGAVCLVAGSVLILVMAIRSRRSFQVAMPAIGPCSEFDGVA